MDLKNKKLQGCEFCFPDVSRVVKETANFWVLRDAASYEGLTDTHFVIVSKDHHACMGELPLQHFEELKGLKQEIKRSLKRSQGPVISYEHGKVGHCITLHEKVQVCHHFHLNILSIDVDISEELDARFYSIYVEHLDEVSKLYERFSEYLFFENADGDMRYYIVDELIEPQLLKRLLLKKALLGGSTETNRHP